jgi:hypothetical protein
VNPPVCRSCASGYDAVETYFLAGNGKEGREVLKVLGEFISK